MMKCTFAVMTEHILLAPHRDLRCGSGPVVLLILDGVGIGRGDEFDAVALANTPALDALRQRALSRRLRAHGTAVGLPSDDDMGNSEVGHNILGAGRIFPQGATLVELALDSGTIWTGVWTEMIEYLKNTGGALHLIGLLSDGNVHSHEKHLDALIRRAASEGLPRLYVHPLLDGRDVPPQSSLVYVDRLEQLLETMRSHGREYWIASGGGRMVTTMDRYEADWGIVKRGWDAHVLGRGQRFPSARAAIEEYRRRDPGISDQFLDPFVICDSGGLPRGQIQDGDAVVLFNFRGDRAIEICEAFEGGNEFTKFDRERVPSVFIAGMMLYDGDKHVPKKCLVFPPQIHNTISELLVRSGVRQLACAETQKFGHVTYFWNGNRSAKFDDRYEDYIEIPSDRIPFEQAPAMKSKETAKVIVDAVRSNTYRFIRANFAAGDMVGHTGVIEAAVAAIEAVDAALAQIEPVVRASGGTLVVTADHGNAEDMVERDAAGLPRLGRDGTPMPRTSHSLNPVPFFVLDSSRPLALRQDLPEAGLANVASTLLELLGYQFPRIYEPSLLLFPA
jgi:2,3-bisphosphoglycerate-independent phosphoglycerate mutase